MHYVNIDYFRRGGADIKTKVRFTQGREGTRTLSLFLCGFV
jgi:hypothetical protein